MSTAEALAPAAAEAPAAPTALERAMGAALVERGLMTAEQVAADQRGEMVAEPERHYEPIVADPDAGANAHVMAGAFNPPADPSGYRLPQLTHFDPKVAADFQNFAHSAGMDTTLASTFAREFDVGLDRAKTPGALAKHATDSEWQLRRMWGPKFGENLALANTEVARLAAINPILATVLAKTGMGNSPALVAALHTRALARKGA